ncbi:unnamed protein product [Blepharisma stoltei]|uniref:Uncharacterized protein n=1 Tax=Blepharisma stoltei TaxID=1481888 RepID=A0AAU9JPB3_9CILI|nr:unnamed protein product [Blepharisma stoltei]
MSLERNLYNPQQNKQVQLKIPPLNMGWTEKKPKPESLSYDHDSMKKISHSHAQSTLDFSSFSQSKTMRSINRVNREQLKDFLSVERKAGLIAAKSCRDVSHLKDEHQLSKHNVKLPDLAGNKSVTQVLPISPEHLKMFINSTDKLGFPATSPRGIMNGLGCSKEKCLEKVMGDTESTSSFQDSLDQFKSKIKAKSLIQKSSQSKFLDSVLTQKKIVQKEDPFIYLGSPSGRQEVQNLNEWYNYMQENYLNKFLDQKILSEMGEEEKNDKFEIADVILKTGLREIVRQVSVHCVERGELLSVIAERYLDYWKICCSLLEDANKKIKEDLTKEIDKLHAIIKEKDRMYNQKILELGRENAFIQASSNIKDIEINRLHENIRKFKAEREYRMKKDFEHYTNAIRKFQEELKESEFNNSDYVKTGKSKVFIMQKLDEAQKIVSKLRLRKDFNDAMTIVDSEEGVAWIDQDMLDEEIEEPYKDEEIQVEICKETEDKETMTLRDMVNRSMETDEIEYHEYHEEMPRIEDQGEEEEYQEEAQEIMILENDENNSFLIDEDGPEIIEIKQDVETVNTETEEAEISQDSSDSSRSIIKEKIKKTTDKGKLNNAPQQINFQRGMRRSSTVLGTISKSALDNINHAEISFNPKSKIRADSTNGYIYPSENKKWLSETKKRKNRECQTEGLLDEDIKNKEIIELMISDREELLKKVQKEILTNKNELNKLRLEADRYRTFIHEISQQNPEEAKHLYEKIERDVEKLKEKGYIPEELDFSSWKAGYYSGFDNGHFEGKILGEEIGFERGMTEGGSNPQLNSSILDISNSTTEENGIPKELLLKAKERKGKRRPSVMVAEEVETRKNKRATTKIMEFTFNKREPKTQADKKIHMGPKLLEHFLSKSLERIKNFGKISRKMLTKNLSYIYSCAIAKLKTGELMDSLAEFAYDELFGKYGLKKVADKKYLEIVSTALKYPDSIKISTFARLMGIGSKIDLIDFSRPKLSFIFYISSISNIFKSKAGIIVGYDDSSEYQMIPSIRATECIKEKFNDLTSQSQIQRIIAAVEKLSQPDPKKVNKSGVIDQDVLLEIMLSEYEIYQSGIVSALNVIFDGLSVANKVVYINKADLVLITRYISPHKISLLVNKDENNKETYSQALVNLCQNDEEEEDEEVHIDKVINFCIEKTICSPNDLENYVGGEVTRNRLFNFFEDSKNENMNILMKILKNKAAFGMSSSFERSWIERIQYFSDQINKKQPKALYCAWKLITDELARLNGELQSLEKSKSLL